ncbi:TRAP transporter large permease [Wenxinia marina]|uniref:TRAP transporter large permease protein n=1 Tax=Wenxinia marina DSM 24838 TaxID=1123501 RepID=A0A0D0QGY6_9RHOB|nr:TRAP transporter large permease [Wenxinia marina]KIQ70283.1 TRAP transporter, DctM subunit [Wenxinia marina DSM 24838]GGL49816.1 C4-dicarboxylate ABC transporter [Wenxinia marina]
MDRLDIGLLGLVVTLVLIGIRVPIGVAMGLVSFGGIWMMMGQMPAIGIAKAIPYEMIGDWNLSAVPMFLLMGYVASGAGLTQGLFRAARVFLNRIPGGLAIASVASSGLFASASGSSVATAAAFSRIAIPEMLKAGYAPSLASGSVAAAGTLGSLIPPSVLLIIYGLMMDVSISTLFLAAVVPGVLSGLVFAAMIAARCTLNPTLAPRLHERYTAREKLAMVRETWPLPVLIAGVLGGIFTGIFTATEAGAVGAFLAFLIALVRGTLSVAMVRSALIDTAVGTASIFIIVVAAALFARFIALSTLPVWVTGQLSGLDTMWVIILICLLYLVLGCFLESISIILLTVPVLAPLLGQMDVNLIWFGVLAVKLLETGLITPPVGMNVYVIRSSLGPEMPLGTIFRGVSWFILADAFTIALLVAFPALTLWLPGLSG